MISVNAGADQNDQQPILVNNRAKDFRITIKQKEEHVTQVVSAPVQAVSVQASSIQPAPQHVPRQLLLPKSLNSNRNFCRQFVTIKSLMIGTFYRRSGPDKPAFC
jgi:acetyl-CoA carboxylase biotin carboxyl carrier protein